MTLSVPGRDVEGGEDIFGCGTRRSAAVRWAGTKGDVALEAHQ